MSNSKRSKKRREREEENKMGFFGAMIESLRYFQIRLFLTLIIRMGMILTSTLIIWKGLMCLAGTRLPLGFVLSGSMEPGIKRGDILFFHMSKDPIRTGDIVAFIVDGQEITIVHRVIKLHERQETGEVDILTKGDKNFEDDRLLYAHGQLWLQQHHIIGRAVGYLPYVGWKAIIMTEKPLIKYFLTGPLELLVSLERLNIIALCCLHSWLLLGGINNFDLRISAHYFREACMYIFPIGHMVALSLLSSILLILA